MRGRGVKINLGLQPAKQKVVTVYSDPKLPTFELPTPLGVGKIVGTMIYLIEDKLVPEHLSS